MEPVCLGVLTVDRQTKGMRGIRDELVFEKTISRGRILERIWDKSLKSFPPCYSQSPLLTDSHPPLSKSGLKLVCNVNIVYSTEISSLRTLKIIPRNLN